MNLSDDGEMRIRGYLFMLESSLRAFAKNALHMRTLRSQLTGQWGKTHLSGARLSLAHFLQHSLRLTHGEIGPAAGSAQVDYRDRSVAVAMQALAGFDRLCD